MAAPRRGSAPGGSEAPVFAEARSAVGFEGERGTGRWLHGQGHAREADDEAAVHALADVDTLPGGGAPVGTTRQLEHARAEADDVVAPDESRVATAQLRGEIAGGRAPRGGGVRGGMREAAVEVGEEGGQ